MLVAFALLLLSTGALRLLYLPWPEDLPLVAHAGGSVDGAAYTNSIAALERSHSLGFRLFEVDLQSTADGKFVCGHDWDAFGGRAPEYERFLEWRHGLAHPPCTIDDLIGWFNLRREAILVTDAKDSPLEINTMLVGLLPGRVIVQAYDREELCAYAASGVPRIILTKYRLRVGLTELPSYLQEPCPDGRTAEAITMSGGKVYAGIALATKFATGLPIYAHTVNDCVSAWLLLLMGADSFYTDDIAPGDCLLPGRGP